MPELLWAWFWTRCPYTNSLVDVPRRRRYVGQIFCFLRGVEIAGTIHVMIYLLPLFPCFSIILSEKQGDVVRQPIRHFLCSAQSGWLVSNADSGQSVICLKLFKRNLNRTAFELGSSTVPYCTWTKWTDMNQCAMKCIRLQSFNIPWTFDSADLLQLNLLW